jgi:hypothetical protein|uniref:Uncharacterized protein n=1 Tax=Rhodococcus sp. NS1 TaxID=402236 RepID=A0A097SQA5_9NOCA|nr:hypothetical protein LRS1606.275 [Rhodococcus sp. NS1]
MPPCPAASRLWLHGPGRAVGGDGVTVGGHGADEGADLHRTQNTGSAAVDIGELDRFDITVELPLGNDKLFDTRRRRQFEFEILLGWMSVTVAEALSSTDRSSPGAEQETPIPPSTLPTQANW